MTTLLLPLAAVLLAGTPRAGPADLASVERRIAKEPAYQTKAPRYCLLVFGPGAKHRVWLVQDGDALYVDRNANGDLTESGERVTAKGRTADQRVFEVGDLRDGPLTHTGLTVARMRATPEYAGDPKEFERIKGIDGEPWVWIVRVSAEGPADDDRPLPKRIGYVVNGDGLGYLVFAARPQDAPVIHFNGPWTLGLQDIHQRWTAGQKSRLQIGVGTPGVGPGTFAFVLYYPDTIPADAYPVAEVAYPPADGKPPPRERHVLKHRC